MVADARVWRPAVVLLQQLIELNSTVPAVVFNTSALAPRVLHIIALLKAHTLSLEPRVPVPAEFVSPLKRANGGLGSFLKLGLWAQTQFDKIVVLDVDVLLLSNVDEMVRFPSDTFAPETCAGRCVEGSIAAGVNCGVMVIRPSMSRFEHMCRYMHARARTLRTPAGGRAQARAEAVSKWLLRDAEQSVLNAFYAEELNASLKRPVPERQGWEWEQVSYVEPSACVHRERALRLPPGTCTPGTLHFMSRVYNARPMDCHRCPPSHRPKIVHFACTKKPWVWSEAKWLACAAGTTGANPVPVYCANCSVELALRWHAVQRRVWSKLQPLLDAHK